MKRFLHVVALLATSWLTLSTAYAACGDAVGATLKALGKAESKLLVCAAKVAATNDSSTLAACEAKATEDLAAVFAEAGSCVGDQATCEDRLGDCADAVAAATTDTFPNKCAAAKRKAAGKLAKGEIYCHAKAAHKDAAVDQDCISKAADKFSKALAKAGACPDGGSPQQLVEDNCVEPLVTTDGGGSVVDVCATTTMTTATTTTNTVTTTTLGGLSDSFDGGALDPSWSILHAPVATLTVSGGQLHVEIDSQSNWFNTLESILIYKDVTGDFDVHAALHAAKTSNASQEPDPQFRLGGLLARDPASMPAASNFVHVALGAGSFAVPVASEDKTTTNSVSTYTFHPIAETQGELRLTRTGANFSMYYRPIGDLTWQLLGTHTRADLPATLQVGMMAYDNNGSFDLTVSFDEIVFE